MAVVKHTEKIAAPAPNGTLAQFYVHCVSVRACMCVCFWGVNGFTMKCEKCQTTPKKFNIQNPQSLADWKCEIKDLMVKYAALHCTLKLVYCVCVGFCSTHSQVCVQCQFSICSGSLDNVFIKLTIEVVHSVCQEWARHLSQRSSLNINRWKSLISLHSLF